MVLHQCSRRGWRIRFAVLTLLSLSLLPAAGRAEVVRETFGLADGATAAAKPGRPIPSRELNMAAAVAPVVSLAPVDREGLIREDEMKKALGLEKLERFSVGREVVLQAADGDWYDLPGGARLWMVDLQSSGALGLRLHFDRLRLPAGARIAVYSPEDRAAHYLRTGEDLPEGTRAQQFESAAELQSRGGWTGTVVGDTARLEVFLPQGANRRSLPFVLDRVQHLYRDPVSLDLEKGAGFCHNDVTCFSDWTVLSKAVARISFVIGGDGFVCTGQLLNASNNDKTPYFLTARHCISSNTVAQTVEAFWKFQTSTCGGAPPSLGSVPTSEGASLLASGSTSDFAFLMIDGALPSGLFWAGWTSALIPASTFSASIHHPAGDFKRISFGNNVLQSSGCADTGFLGSSHIRINWLLGPTEGGSSGAGIFRVDTQQLYGQLHCGPSSCANVSNDAYGSFFHTFPAIASLLQGGSDDSFENNDNCLTPEWIGAGTYSALKVKSTDEDWYRIAVPNGKTLTVKLTFTHANGDVDASMHYDCELPGIDTSTSTSNQETLTYHNTTGVNQYVSWRVRLFSDTRNNYNMTVTLP